MSNPQTPPAGMRAVKFVFLYRFNIFLHTKNKHAIFADCFIELELFHRFGISGDTAYG